MNTEHYLSKIERNANVLDKAPEGIKEECLLHIKWARSLVDKLQQLDYQERNDAINKIHEVMDSDYISMGFTLETENENNRSI